VYLAKILEAYLVGGYNVADTGNLSPAVSSGLPHSDHQTAAGTLPDDFSRAGASTANIAAAERDAMIERLTGVSAETQQRQATRSRQAMKQYQFMPASKLADAVVRGRCSHRTRNAVIDFQFHICRGLVQGAGATPDRWRAEGRSSITSNFGRHQTTEQDFRTGVRVEDGDIVVASDKSRNGRPV
jgi:hypothetical protein